MRLLLVEDEKRLLEALSHLLRHEGFEVDSALNGKIGQEMAVTGVYDVIILDVILPDLDGFSVLKAFRDQGFDTPVLFLTASDDFQDRIAGLNAGADDYLVKPFCTEEFIARIRALNRRKDRTYVGNTIRAADLTLDSISGKVTKSGKVIPLGVKEYLLLELLMRNPGQVLTKELILEKIWGYYSENDNVDNYIYSLRKKLDTSCIKTVRGIGYFLQEDLDFAK